MGFDSCDSWTSKAQVVKELLADTARRAKVVAHKSTRSGLWSVIENDDGSRAILFDLIERSNRRYFVKAMDESCNPYFYDCPLAFLGLVPQDKTKYYSAKWREGVEAFHSRRLT